MSTKIGRFEVLSELSRSAIGAVYKASDPESGQTIALKIIRPEALGEQYAPFIQGVLEEATASQVLNSHNVTQLFGAQEMDGQFCAAMEYVQGNSIGTMLARKEGFSIWDLQDIARQSCQGLDHAHVRQIAHFSLEPAKIMVSWDGTVKILSFGVSRMSTFNFEAPGKASEVLHYMSPEQLRGEAVDPRSNMFSLGAILYEMVTETRAFPGEDADQVRQLVQEQMPVPPDRVNRKLHPALSEVIMKALAKAPEARYQNGQELVNDLERCKESAAKAAAKKPAAAAQPAKVVAPATTPRPPAPVAKPQTPPPAAVAAQKAVAAKANVEPRTEVAAAKPAREFAVTPAAAPPAEEPAPQADHLNSAPAAVPAWRAAAAGFGGADSTSAELPRTPKLDSSEQFISTCVKASVDALAQEETMSAAGAKPQPAAPKIAVDPTMQEAGQGEGARGLSFSEIDELPPLKEAYVPPPPPPVEAAPVEPPPATVFRSAAAEKPKVQPQVVAKEAARKAVVEIKKTPPKLFMYSIAAAVGVILLVVIGIMFHIHSENAEDNAESPGAARVTQAPPQTATTQPAPVAPAQPETTTVEVETPAPARRPAVSVTPKYNRRKVRTQAPVLLPGQLTINSTPQGAEVSLDDRHDPSWVTPFNMSGLLPGQHLVKVTKAGFAAETRSIEVASGSKSFMVVELAPLTATLAVSTTPSGAAVLLDGKDTGHVTPTQFSIDKAGSHTVLVRKQGYLDETTTANFQPGQLLHFSPTLRALGNTDDIKIGGGKLKRIFGGGGEAAGMGAVSVRTQPRGAQVAVNNRILDKLSPLEFYLNPGTYVVDITLTGYKNVHRVINVEKDGKVSIEETLDRE